MLCQLICISFTCCLFLPAVLLHSPIAVAQFGVVVVVAVGFGVGARIVHCCQVADLALPAAVVVVEVGNTMGMDGKGWCQCHHQLVCMDGCFFPAFSPS